MNMGLKLQCPLYIVGLQMKKKSYCTWWPDNKFNPKQTSDPPKKWLVNSTRKTEYHQSSNAGHNGPTAPYLCTLCQRRFKSKVNLTKHVYWHTINDDNRDDDPADPMEVIESQDEDELYRFTITITIFCFISWMASNINHYHSNHM